MKSYRNVGDDLLKKWLDFRKEDSASLSCKVDKENLVYLYEISQQILNNISGNNMEYVKLHILKLRFIYIYVLNHAITNSIIIIYFLDFLSFLVFFIFVI